MERAAIQSEVITIAVAILGLCGPLVAIGFLLHAIYG